MISPQAVGIAERKRFLGCGLVLVAAVAFSVIPGLTAEPSDEPKPVPVTRGDMKLVLEGLKQRSPRLSSPPQDNSSPLMRVQNGAMRRYYLPASWYAADFRPDPKMTLDNTFKVRLFWIVSRMNNCQYCLGHQEHKLLAAGMKEDEIAALDSRWDVFPESEREAFKFTRKLTSTPHLMTEEDLASLARYYPGEKSLEIIYTVAMFNSVNRWTDSLGLPQDSRLFDHDIKLDTPTSPEYAERATIVVGAADEPRGPLESDVEVEQKLASAKDRQPVVPLASEADARKALGNTAWQGPIPAWMRALANFPETGSKQIAATLAIETDGKLSPRVKAGIAAVAARNNRAWASLAIARQRMERAGITPADIPLIERNEVVGTPAEQAAWAFARKLTVSPKAMTDADIARLRQHYNDFETAEIVYATCAANLFDRFTEASRIPAN